jgi:hypothetical protein
MNVTHYWKAYPVYEDHGRTRETMVKVYTAATGKLWQTHILPENSEFIPPPGCISFRDWQQRYTQVNAKARLSNEELLKKSIEWKVEADSTVSLGPLDRLNEQVESVCAGAR